MFDFLSSISPRGKLLIVVLIIALMFVSLSYWTSGWQLSILVSGILCFILFLTKGVWLSDDHGKNLIRRMSLGLILLLTGTYTFWNQLLVDLLQPYFQQIFPDASLPKSAPSAIVLAFAFAVIAVVNYFMRDRTVMKEHSSPIEKEFPEKDFKVKLKQYVKILENELNNIDIETTWHDFYFTPLEAEVEVIANNKRQKKVTDLLKAIKSDKKNQAILILGDPGSGKSTALRKVARDLLSEVWATGKIPIYINLKEWQTNAVWNRSSPPTASDLYHFILKSLKRRGDVFSNDFLDQYFKKMFENGRIFFLLDSFDEIPLILDANESSWIIDELSDVIYKFLVGAHDSRGILSSRIFRKPTNKFKSKVILEIRPLSEIKIEETFRKALSTLSKQAIADFFQKRHDLVPVARNPFSAFLIVNYLKESKGEWPQNQAQLYSSYVRKRLESSKERMQQQGLTADRILATSNEIAYYIFSSESSGLEITVEDLKRNISSVSRQQLEAIVDVLRFARIARVSESEKKFSFVHRRFNEYFVVNHILSNDIELKYDNIPTDSRWRDALVLFCEVAPDEKVIPIAEFCWKEIINLQNEDIESTVEQYMRSIHCLRFLSDAFRTRKELIGSFEPALAKLIIDNIRSNRSILLTKFSVEATGILNNADIEEAIVSAFELNNTWIYEIALKASRHLPSMEQKLHKKIKNYIYTLTIGELFRNSKELYFSVSLSDGFRKIKRILSGRAWDYKIFAAAVLVLIVLIPPAALVVVAYGFVTFAADSSREYVNNLLVLRVLMCIFLMLIVTQTISAESQGFLMLSSFLPLILDFPILFKIIFSTLFICILPIFDIIVQTSRLKKGDLMPPSIKEFPAVFTGMALIGGFGMGINYLFKISLVETVLKYVLIGGATLCICLFGWITIKDYLLYMKLKKKLKHQPEVSRGEIESAFSSLEMETNRLNYVRLLYNYSIQPYGTWPSGKLPNEANDKASILLAQLEEKWLGLN